MFKKFLSILFVFISTSTLLKAQDAEYSQFYANPLYLNPAMAGTTQSPRFILNYRNQYPGVNQAFEQFSASFDQDVPKLNGGIGVLINSDNLANGAYRSLSVAGLYSYLLEVNDKVTIKAGLKAGFTQKTLDFQDLTFRIDDFGNPLPSQEPQQGLASKSFGDFGAGFLIFSEYLYAGVAGDHLTQPDQSLTGVRNSQLPLKITAHGGASIPINDGSFYISPNVLYQQQANFNQLNAGLYFSKGPIVLGGWYRYAFENGDALIAMAGVKVGSFKVGYSYDYTTSAFQGADANAHEVSLTFGLTKSEKGNPKAQYRILNCPSF